MIHALLVNININEIEKQRNEDFENICNWFDSNKISIHFGDDKIRFATKFKIKEGRKQNIRFEDIQIKQHLILDIWDTC